MSNPAASSPYSAEILAKQAKVLAALTKGGYRIIERPRFEGLDLYKDGGFSGSVLWTLTGEAQTTRQCTASLSKRVGMAFYHS